MMSGIKAANKPKTKTKAKSLTRFPVDGDHREEIQIVAPPKRAHSLQYHRPRLLNNTPASTALLSWFDATSQTRQMPWRKPWLNPTEFLSGEEDFRKALAERAYEIWVSEIMLQQTRVSVVIAYFNNWITKWPTIEDLAAATQDEVLAAWKGLGYYSRATRLHEAAKQIVAEIGGSLPADVAGLLKIKGIGRYTAGAVSSIAFGRAVPLLDGNVGRVLCRQLGLYAKVKDKKVEDLLWEVTDALVKNVAQHGEEDGVSNIPGRWNQALMELGSTVCTPKPRCQDCPIQPTCHAYAEGELLSAKEIKGEGGNKIMDIEDACQLCEPLELEEVEVAVDEGQVEEKAVGKNKPQTRKRAATATTLASRPAKTSKANDSTQRSLRDFASFAVPKPKIEPPRPVTNAKKYAQIIGYCSLFPKREPKRQVPEEECLVCIVRYVCDNGDQYLIEKRPPKGLLASLWQFPTYTILAKTETTLKTRKADSTKFIQTLLGDGISVELNAQGEMGPVTHIFSHLKLRMYIHTFDMKCDDEDAKRMVNKEVPRRVWVDKHGADTATLGTGMRRCWEQYKREKTG
jgi:A/G-specific adenine glycosylase